MLGLIEDRFFPGSLCVANNKHIFRPITCKNLQRQKVIYKLEVNYEHTVQIKDTVVWIKTVK